MEIKIKQITPVEAKANKGAIVTYIFESVALCNFQEKYDEMQAEEKFELLYQYMLDDKAIVIGAFDENHMVGFLWAYAHPFREDTNRLYVSIVHVDENYRYHHIGTKMIEKIEEIAREKNFDAIFLHAEASNTNACQFYEKMGFIRERIQYVRRAVSDMGQEEINENIRGGVLTGTVSILEQNKKAFAELYYQNIKAHSCMENFNLSEAEEKINEFQKYLEKGRAFGFYALHQDMIAGFVWMHPISYQNQNRIYIYAISVLSQFQGLGIASQIYRYVLGNVFRNEVIYTHVDSSNKASCALHKKFGFKEENCQYIKRLLKD